jgi:DNA-binding LacI/PurR family transcriptional regulator
MSSVSGRIRGYERALIDHGLVPSPEWKIWCDSQPGPDNTDKERFWVHAYEPVLPLLKALEPPVAVFALNGDTGRGVVEACRVVGLRVPDDVSIVCFDDSEITRAISPPMTTIAQHPVELGRRALELLEQRRQSPTAKAQRVVLDVDLIKRESVKSLTGRGRGQPGPSVEQEGSASTA